MNSKEIDELFPELKKSDERLMEMAKKVEERREKERKKEREHRPFYVI